MTGLLLKWALATQEWRNGDRAVADEVLLLAFRAGVR